MKTFILCKNTKHCLIRCVFRARGDGNLARLSAPSALDNRLGVDIYFQIFLTARKFQQEVLKRYICGPLIHTFWFDKVACNLL